VIVSVDVAVGSKATLSILSGHVRFTPIVLQSRFALMIKNSAAPGAAGVEVQRIGAGSVPSATSAACPGASRRGADIAKVMHSDH
jgi:hypothetical protein